MKNLVLILCLTIFFMIQLAESNQILKDDANGETVSYPRTSSNIYLKKAVGEGIEIMSEASTEAYEVYFHVPISFGGQVPILIEVESPNLIDYRFIRLPNSPNILCAAKLISGVTSLNWTAWVIIEKSHYSDVPDSVPIPQSQNLPDSVLQWLQSSDCIQTSAPIVQETAASIRGTTSNLITLADSIADYCHNIPGYFYHEPIAFDAVYTLNWGNSCTGHAHAGAALFRANGIPARSILNLLTETNIYFDMHWIIDYFVPGYGWVFMETSAGRNFFPAQHTVVLFVSNLENEFPAIVPVGLDGYWFTSDPTMWHWDPRWGQSHRAFDEGMIVDSETTIRSVCTVTDSVFNYYTQYFGIKLTDSQQETMQSAIVHQNEALNSFKNNHDLDSYLVSMNAALDCYNSMDIKPEETFYFDDFENGTNGWAHGGDYDEWELGTPSYGAFEACSGTTCWGTDLDDTYENNANNWLLSPVIDLKDKACAYLDFRLWNSVEDAYIDNFNDIPHDIYDPLWVEITIDGDNFEPICSKLGGVNDDPAIDWIGGWNRIVLDLNRYIGNDVQIRFHFSSNEYEVHPGAYIDDVKIYGRDFIPIQEESKPVFSTPNKFALHQNYPNPFNPSTTIQFEIPVASQRAVKLQIYDISGKLIRILIDEPLKAGYHTIIWSGKDDAGDDVASGVYFYRIDAGNYSDTKSMLLLK